MRSLVCIAIFLIAFVLIAGGPCLATPQQDTPAMQSMTVAELEKAGDAARAQKDYPLAIQCFEEALRKDRKNAKLYNKLGLAELSAGDYGAARFHFAKATKYDHNYPEAWNDLGVVFFIEKNYRAATKYFSKAIALNEGRPNFHVNLGITYFTMNDPERAMVQYTRALELDPNALLHSSNTGMSAQLATREERARLDFMIAKVYANLGNMDDCLMSLRKAKEDGYASLQEVYKDECFARVRQDPRLAEIIPPPAK